MTTALISHRDGLLHLTPEGHPERPERLKAIDTALNTSDFTDLLRLEAPKASDAEIGRAHPARYLERLRVARPGPLDADTYLSPGSLDAALGRSSPRWKAATTLTLLELQSPPTSPS